MRPTTQFDAGSRLRLSVPKDFTSHAYTTGSTQVVVLDGDVDFEAVDRFTRAIDTAARQAPALVVLDSSELTFIDSRGLGAVVDARNHLRGRSADLVIRGASAMLTRLLGIAGLTTLLEEG
jgi:anti-anti-sigma factor